MHKNQIWLTFLATTVLIVFWFSGMTGYELYNYVTLNSKTLPTEVNWLVQRESSDRYSLRASYKYQVKGDVYEGETTVNKKFFRSPKAAQKRSSQNSQKKWMIWYASYNPEHSTIQKIFPLKSCIYTAVMWGVLIYFIWLGFYVGQFKSHTIQKDFHRESHHP